MRSKSCATCWYREPTYWRNQFDCTKEGVCCHRDWLIAYVEEHGTSYQRCANCTYGNITDIGCKTTALPANEEAPCPMFVGR